MIIKIPIYLELSPGSYSPKEVDALSSFVQKKLTEDILDIQKGDPLSWEYRGIDTSFKVVTRSELENRLHKPSAKEKTSPKMGPGGYPE